MSHFPLPPGTRSVRRAKRTRPRIVNESLVARIIRAAYEHGITKPELCQFLTDLNLEPCEPDIDRPEELVKRGIELLEDMNDLLAAVEELLTKTTHGIPIPLPGKKDEDAFWVKIVRFVNLIGRIKLIIGLLRLLGQAWKVCDEAIQFIVDVLDFLQRLRPRP